MGPDKRTEVILRLITVIKKYEQIGLFPNLNSKASFALGDDNIAAFVKFLKSRRHPITQELEEVGLMDFYKTIWNSNSDS